MYKYIKASAWTAPNGKKYGKQKRTGRYSYRFTKRELDNMVADGVAEAISNADEAWDLLSGRGDIIGIAWNETNGYTSGVLFKGNDGNLYVGNTGVAQVIC